MDHYDVASELTDELGCSKDFLVRLLGDDDWTCVIKAHTLIEAVVTHVLVNGLGEEVRKFVEELPLRRGLELAQSLSLFPADLDETRLKGLGKVRNLLAHDVSQTEFTFASPQSQSAKDCCNAFFSAFIGDVTGKIVLNTCDGPGCPTVEREHDKKVFLHENPRWAIVEFLVFFLAGVSSSTKNIQIRREAIERFCSQVFQTFTTSTTSTTSTSTPTTTRPAWTRPSSGEVC